MIPRLVRAWSRVDARLQRAPALVGDAVGAALCEALTLAEMEAASVAIFDGARGRDALFDWEARWLGATLPPPPAEVLVTGAGAGVEVAALAARGYVVDAADPAPALCARLREGPARAVLQADHHGALREGRYDAILFGWGSFTCVLNPAAHRQCLERAAQICKGPILLSFWLDTAAGPRPAHLGARAGRALGRLVGRARGLRAAGDLRFQHWSGFGYVFAAAEIEALAAGIGRRVVWGAAIYPHVGLMPVADPGA